MGVVLFVEKDEKTIYPNDPIVAKFKELFDFYEVWNTDDKRLPILNAVFEKIEAKESEEVLRDVIKISSLEVINFKESNLNNDDQLDIFAITLLGEMKVTECVERLIDIYDNALFVGSEYITHYHENWEHDELADLRSACVLALSKINDPRGYSTIYGATLEEHHYVASDAWKELTYERFKYATKNNSIYNLKRLKYPLDWSKELGYDAFVDNVLEERGYGIQDEEHLIAEKLVYLDEPLDDYEPETDQACYLSEQMKSLDFRKLLIHLITEYQVFALDDNLRIRSSTFLAFFFKLYGSEKAKQELEALLVETADTQSQSILDDLLSLIENPEFDNAFEYMTQRLEFNEKERIKSEKRKTVEAKRKEPIDCPLCGHKIKSPKCKCIQKTGVGYLTPDEKSTYLQFYKSKRSVIAFWIICGITLVIISVITIWFLTR